MNIDVSRMDACPQDCPAARISVDDERIMECGYNVYTNIVTVSCDNEEICRFRGRMEEDTVKVNDSREKLEADIEKCLNWYYEDKPFPPHRAWLDRQAAITRAECERDLVSMRGYDDALCDEVRELRAELELRTMERDASQHALDEANRRLRVICEASAMLGAYRGDVDA